MVDIKITFDKNELDLIKHILDKENYQEYLKELVLKDMDNCKNKQIKDKLKERKLWQI